MWSALEQRKFGSKKECDHVIYLMPPEGEIKISALKLWIPTQQNSKIYLWGMSDMILPEWLFILSGWVNNKLSQVQSAFNSMAYCEDVLNEVMTTPNHFNAAIWARTPYTLAHSSQFIRKLKWNGIFSLWSFHKFMCDDQVVVAFNPLSEGCEVHVKTMVGRALQSMETKA